MLPQHLCAYFHVSSFILDIVVLYPEMPCLSLGGLSFHVYPKKVIDNGTNSEQRNKNINIVATSSQFPISQFQKLEFGVCFINFFRFPQVRSWNSYFFQVHLWLLHNMIY